MTISESLISLSNYPIPDSTIVKICVIRGLDSTVDFTETSQDYELAEADVYIFLHASPNLSEQEISFSQDDRNRFLSLANDIYGKYDDPKFNGGKYGFVGQEWND